MFRMVIVTNRYSSEKKKICWLNVFVLVFELRRLKHAGDTHGSTTLFKSLSLRLRLFLVKEQLCVVARELLECNEEVTESKLEPIRISVEFAKACDESLNVRTEKESDSYRSSISDSHTCACEGKPISTNSNSIPSRTRSSSYWGPVTQSDRTTVRGSGSFRQVGTCEQATCSAIWNHSYDRHRWEHKICLVWCLRSTAGKIHLQHQHQQLRSCWRPRDTLEEKGKHTVMG